MTDKTIRVGLIGAGGNARSRHIPGFQAIDGVEVGAVCDRSEESGRRVTDEFGIEGVATAPEPQALAPDPGAAHDGRVEQDFIDSIREGTPVELTSFEDGVLYMQFVEAVWRSWSEGRPVALAEL